MPIYLYCLLTAPAEPVPPGLAGIDGAPVRMVTVGELGAWLSDVGPVSPEPSVTNARAHDRVVTAAMAVRTPLPARFGQIFQSDEALRTALIDRRESLLLALRRVEGRCEMTVRVLLDGASPAAAPAVGATTEPVGGREYLHRIRERDRMERARQGEADFLHESVRQAVAGLVREEVQASRPQALRSTTVSHLVDRRDVPQYRVALRSFQETHPALRLMVSGPWAPYSFTGLDRV